MAVLRVDNYIEAYRLRALSPDIHRLTARNSVAQTEFALSQIVEKMNLGAEDVLVDIGCGDGSLLKMAEGRVARRIGVVPTVEEKVRVQTIVPGAEIVSSLAQELSLDPGIASKIVCNGVLILLHSEDRVMSALREMHRIARPGATIWVGEMPEVDEYAVYGKYSGTSMTGMLWHLLKHNGLRAFLGMCRRWLRAAVGKEQIVLNSAGIYYAEPAKMIAMAQACGLRLKTYFRHKDLDQQGNIVDSRFRYDYVFDK
ncbi:MAG TPA: methyltransferase domain-containing protein [Candidatus Dormibacteraeota bacterium]|nr:methyltransferase domain-containing protein [Candidatus Dormibacteraeota bacterium]